MNLSWYIYYCIITEQYIITNNSGSDHISGPHTLDDARIIAANLNNPMYGTQEEQ